MFSLADVDPDELDELWPYLTEIERADIDALLRNGPVNVRMPHQIAPPPSADWSVFLCIGGRGIGKTVCGAEECRDELWRNPKARIGVGAPTWADARDTCAEGETGLITMYRHEFKYYNRSLGEARHINGGYVKFMGTEKPKRWNGPQWSFLWFDELALCNKAAWDDANFGLRLGDWPRAVCTTTPKAAKWVEDLTKEPGTIVPYYIDDETGQPRPPTTFDNPYLPAHRVDVLKKKYLGTRIGQRELMGLFVGAREGAMWQPEIIARETDLSKLPRMVRKIVAVDPAGTAARETADENALTEDDRKRDIKRRADTALCVAGLGTDGRIYVFRLVAKQWTPNEWAEQAIKFMVEYKCDRIVAEKNYGGLMVAATITNVAKIMRMEKRLSGPVAVKLVNATDGKRQRAEPVVALDEQAQIIHTAIFQAAEDQMCAFISTDDNEGADMVDARTWAVWDLMGWNSPGKVTVVGKRQPQRAFIVGGSPTGFRP
jgi:predicted phage terminase large subunit-like protein